MKRIPLLLTLLFSFVSYQALAGGTSWSSDTQSAKVFLINWTCLDTYNEEDGSLTRERFRDQEIVIVLCDDQGETITSISYLTWRDGRDRFYEGSNDSDLVISRTDGRRGIIQIGNENLVAMATFDRNGDVRAAVGTTRYGYVDGHDSYAEIQECRATVRADRRLTRLLETELDDGFGFSEQAQFIIEDYLEDRGYEFQEDEN